MAAGWMARGARKTARSVGKIGRKRQGGATGPYVNRKNEKMTATQIRQSGQRRMMGAGVGVGGMMMMGGGGRSSGSQGMTPRSSGGGTL